MTPAPRRILVFGRVPIPGRVKTRLIPTLGAGGAAALYERLLFDTLTLAAAVADADVEFWYDPDGSQAAHGQDLADRFGVSGHLQVGADLGARMSWALGAETCGQRRPALLIGSDCPGFDRAYLAAAFAALAAEDAVLGPALDGGYILIGVQRTHPRLFADIPWGTDVVLDVTRARLRELGWRWRELAPLRDIDRPEDLAHFPDLCQGPPGAAFGASPAPGDDGGGCAAGPQGTAVRKPADPARGGDAPSVRGLFSRRLFR